MCNAVKKLPMCDCVNIEFGRDFLDWLQSGVRKCEPYVYQRADIVLEKKKPQLSRRRMRHMCEKGVGPEDTVPNHVKKEYGLKRALAKEQCRQAARNFLHSSLSNQVLESNDACETRVIESRLVVSEFVPWYPESSRSSLYGDVQKLSVW